MFLDLALLYTNEIPNYIPLSSVEYILDETLLEKLSNQIKNQNTCYKAKISVHLDLV